MAQPFDVMEIHMEVSVAPFQAFPDQQFIFPRYIGFATATKVRKQPDVCTGCCSQVCNHMFSESREYVSGL